MRILYFSQGYTTHDRRFLEGLRTRHEVYFLRLREDHPLDGRELPDGVLPVAFQERTASDDLLDLLPELRRILQRIEPDLVHAGPVPSCAFLMARSGFHPYLAMSWGSDLLLDCEQEPLLRASAMEALRQADGWICDCETVRRKALQWVPFPVEKVLEIPWGIDLEALEVAPGGLREALGWEREIVVLSMRSWEPVYEIETVLKAFARAREGEPRLCLLLLGNGSLAPKVEQTLAELSIRPFVHCPGRISQADLPAYFAAADLYLSCALSDGSSISLLEAMGRGLSVVVTDHPSNREWVCPSDGWLVPPRDAAACADALLEASRLSPAERESRARRNRREIEERADWRRNLQRLLAFYDRVCGR